MKLLHFYSFLFCLFISFVVNAQINPNLSSYSPNQVILRFPVGTTSNYVYNMVLPYHGLLLDSALPFGLFLVEFSTPLNTKDPCADVTVMIQKGCCKPPSGTASTSIQGGGLNYETVDLTFNGNNQSIYWTATWNNIINQGIDLGNTGCDFITAFLDTGIDDQHLMNNAWFDNTSTANIAQFPFHIDDNQHGTHVIGISAQITQYYQNAKLLSIKTQDAKGGGSIWSAIKGIEKAIQQNAKVINLSLAYWPECAPKDEPPLKTAMRIAGDNHNVLFCTAAGNNHEFLVKNGSFFIYPSMYNLDNQINVAAIDYNDNLAYEQNIWGSNFGSDYVNVATHGVDIYSSVLNSSFTDMSGTSMATPHITALATILGVKSCGVHYKKIKECILNNSIPMEGFSHGIVKPLSVIECMKAKKRSEDESISELIVKNEINIYPNPFYEALNLSFYPNNEKLITHCTLHNTMGQILQTRDYQGNINDNWDLFDLKKGIYLLEINNGEIKEIRKVIKQ